MVEEPEVSAAQDLLKNAAQKLKANKKLLLPGKKRLGKSHSRKAAGEERLQQPARLFFCATSFLALGNQKKLKLLCERVE